MKGEVVTVFLRCRGRVLVLKRSRYVGTYQGLWAGISGYIEEGETPLAAAEREILEETGVRRAALVKEGRPLTIVDVDKKWVIHPFLFDVAVKELTLDWEHESWRWVEPKAVESLKSVPGLYEALMEVLD